MTTNDLRPLLALFPHRYPDAHPGDLSGEVRSTPFSGIEYVLNPDGSFASAMRSVDGLDYDEHGFLVALQGLPLDNIGSQRDAARANHLLSEHLDRVVHEHARAGDDDDSIESTDALDDLLVPAHDTEGVALYVLDGYVHDHQPCSALLVEWQAGLGGYSEDVSFEEVWEDLWESGVSVVERWQTRPDADDDYHDLEGQDCQVCGHPVTSPPPAKVTEHLDASVQYAVANVAETIGDYIDPTIDTAALRDVLVARVLRALED